MDGSRQRAKSQANSPGRQGVTGQNVELLVVTDPALHFLVCVLHLQVLFDVNHQTLGPNVSEIKKEIYRSFLHQMSRDNRAVGRSAVGSRDRYHLYSGIDIPCKL